MNNRPSIFELQHSASELALKKLRLVSTRLDSVDGNQPTITCMVCKEYVITAFAVPTKFANFNVCPSCVREMHRVSCDYDPAKIINLDQGDKLPDNYGKED